MWQMVDRIAAHTGRDWPEVVRELLAAALLAKMTELEVLQTKLLVQQKMRQRQGKMVEALDVLSSTKSSGSQRLAAIEVLRKGLED
jgi:hypothetical protein